MRGKYVRTGGARALPDGVLGGKARGEEHAALTRAGGRSFIEIFKNTGATHVMRAWAPTPIDAKIHLCHGALCRHCTPSPHY